MPGPIHNGRIKWFTLFLLLGFVGIAGRLVYLQVYKHEVFSKEVDDGQERYIALQPRRGNILDRNGNILATTVFGYTLGADPTFMGPYYKEVASVLSPFLEMDTAELAAKLEPRMVATRDGRVIPDQWEELKKKLRFEEWNRIQAALKHADIGRSHPGLTQEDHQFIRRLKTRGIYTSPIQWREYPHQFLASQVLGYVGEGEKLKAMNTSIPVLHGSEGLEYRFNKQLTGVPGWRKIVQKTSGGELVHLRGNDIPPKNGHHVFTTLDIRVQGILEDELRQGFNECEPHSMSGIIVRPYTGEVLAMANLPTFDPNNRLDYDPESYSNRAITDPYEPGSTFKVVAIAGALNEKRLSIHDAFDCESGRWVYKRVPLHDHHAYKVLSVGDIVAKSSNIGTAKIALHRLGNETLHEYIQRFGFGRPTGIILPGEEPGLVYDLSRWSGISITRVAIGHELLATLLQTTMSLAAIANDGLMMRPLLVSRLEDDEGRTVATYEPMPVRQVISRETARIMKQTLKKVVSPEGTAPKAELENYVVAGKTGTTVKAYGGNYLGPKKYYSSFVGFFPADNPEVVIAIAVNEPQKGRYGGGVAGPVFKEVAERIASYLNIRPDHLRNELTTTSYRTSN